MSFTTRVEKASPWLKYNSCPVEPLSAEKYAPLLPEVRYIGLLPSAPIFRSLIKNNPPDNTDNPYRYNSLP